MDELRKLINYNRERHDKESTRIIQSAVGATVDGLWGKETIGKVIDWQRERGLLADGKVGPKTFAAIAAAAPVPTKETRAIEPLRFKELMEPTIIVESAGHANPYAASNLDAEYEGWFDEPKRHPETGAFLKPSERAEVRRANKGVYKSFWASRWDADGNERAGTHIGRSEGMIQFAQSPGSLGLYNKEAFEQNPDLFVQIMGPKFKELIDVTTSAEGKTRAVKGLGPGLRNNRVMPVDGHDLWRGPWNERYDELAEHECFKQAQRIVANEFYLVPALALARQYGWSSQTEIAVLFDMCVQFGPGNSRKGAEGYLARAKRKYGDDADLITCLNILSAGHKNRRLKVASQTKPWVHYTW